MMARRPGSVGFDETLRGVQNVLIAFARDARERLARDAT
jgi:hypothetical protein